MNMQTTVPAVLLHFAGGDSHRIGMGCTPDIAAPWYVQYLDPTCPTCRKTLARLRAFDQMELFGEAA